MPRKFTPEDVAAHRQAYKVILSDGRRFVNATTMDEFTRTRYVVHLQEIYERIGRELNSLQEETRGQS